MKSHTPTPAREGTADRAVRRGTPLFNDDIIRSGPARKLLAGMRILIGWTFMWPFIDKVFGLGYATESTDAWISGGTPAQDYMLNATADSPLAGMFTWIAETFGAFADVLFMAGLFGIGLAMLTGAGLKIAAWSGTLLMAFMYLAALPIGQANMGFTNPITDSHWIEALVLLVAAYTLSGDTWGLGRWWGRTVGNSWLR
ncbi:DoxX family protein [Janibacter alittae]|uniref:DoxX family protein n=1 Tax=Janibacter alittae TaxID=3115209 RepID=A0ABZ2MGE7_9MICO